LAQFTRRQVTVALTGDGGDELFAGYPRYAAVALAEQLDQFPTLRQCLAWRLWQKLPGGTRQRSVLRRFKRFSEALGQPLRRRYLDWISIFNESRRAELYHEAFVAQFADSDPAEFLESAWQRAGRRDAVSAASLADLTTYLPCDLMTKVDVASMAHSLECRQPLLDHRLVEFAAQLPRSLKFRRGKGKRILREAFGDLLPAAVFTRPKMGFGVPLGQWFRGELRDLVHDTLLDQTARQRGWFRHDVVERLVREHTAGTFDHSYRLWSLIVLELWSRQWLDRPGGNGLCGVD
jgi:asparagine synthase (glutamine-hydrolysing)